MVGQKSERNVYLFTVNNDARILPAASSAENLNIPFPLSKLPRDVQTRTMLALELG